MFGRTTLPLSYSFWITGPPKRRYSRWNFVAALFTNSNTRIRSLKAAIVDFPLPVTYLLYSRRIFIAEGADVAVETV